MSALTKVVVVGASSAGMANLGASIVEELKADGTFEITVVSRKSSSTSIKGVNVLKLEDSFPQDELENAFAGKDAVVMTTNFQVFGQEDKFINAAVKAGVKRFIPSEFGSNTRNLNTLTMFPMMGAKARVISELKAKEANGLSWTALCVGMFLDMGLVTGFMGYDLKEHTATIWDDGNQRFSSSTRASIAKAVSGVLKHPKDTTNQYVFVSSFETSMNELLSALEKAQGAKYSISHTTAGEEVADGKAMLAKGDFMKSHKLLLAANLLPGYGNNFAEEEKLWNDILGVPQEDIDDAVAQIVRG
ncbi:NmrA-like family protein [Jackrogersella minutella]|nr:NmrA-like family protein [Jackrogersella minutella]